MKFPTLSGRADVDSFKAFPAKDIGFKRWNDEGDFRANAPYRDYDNIVDPVSGFVSAGGDVDRGTGHKKIRPLAQLNDVPQCDAPQSKHSDRKNSEKAPPELRRSNTYEPGNRPWNTAISCCLSEGRPHWNTVTVCPPPNLQKIMQDVVK